MNTLTPEQIKSARQAEALGFINHLMIGLGHSAKSASVFYKLACAYQTKIATITELVRAQLRENAAA